MEILQKERASLNVKDPEAHRLAEAIARATGETITSAVIASLRERHSRLGLRRHDEVAVAADLRAIARRASAHMKKGVPSHGEFLYDEHGLPK